MSCPFDTFIEVFFEDYYNTKFKKFFFSVIFSSFVGLWNPRVLDWVTWTCSLPVSQWGKKSVSQTVLSRSLQMLWLVSWLTLILCGSFDTSLSKSRLNVVHKLFLLLLFAWWHDMIWTCWIKCMMYVHDVCTSLWLLYVLHAATR